MISLGQDTTPTGKAKSVGVVLELVAHLLPHKTICKDCVAPYRVAAGAVCVAGLAGRQRQVSSSGIRQGAASGRQRGQRQGRGLMVIVVMCQSVTDSSSLHARARCLSLSTSSSTAHLLQTTWSVDAKITARVRCACVCVYYSHDITQTDACCHYIIIQTLKTECCELGILTINVRHWA